LDYSNTIPSSWSRCGRYLLTASQDWRAILWDLSTQERLRVVKFSAPVYTAELHPHNHNLFVVSLFEDRPLLVDITEPIPIKHRIPSTPLTEADIPKADNKQATTAAIFSVQGTHIITGTSKGYLNILETATRKIIHSTKLSTGLISLLRIDTSGRHLLVNSTDRIIRVVQLPDLSRILPSSIPSDAHPDDTLPESLAENISLPTLHKFQDLVNRLRWNDCAFSHSASTLDQTPDYVTASTYMKKDIYIWELRTNSLLRILENREEPAIIEWHPSRPLLAATSIETGSIQMWGIEPQQKWSALAPDFSEVTENVEYIEQEDEFDAYPEEELHKRRLDREDEDVDVLNVVLAGANEERGVQEEESFVLPMLFDIENSDDEEELIRMGAGTMRKKEVNEGKEYALEDTEEGAGGVVGRTAPVVAAGAGRRRR
jgi:COMPASS component SWD1